MAPRTKKVTFNLRESVLHALDEAVSEGEAPSKNALVERALIRELTDLRRMARQRRWKEAAHDPLLLHDIAEVEADFQSSDAEAEAREH